MRTRISASLTLMVVLSPVSQVAAGSLDTFFREADALFRAHVERGGVRYAEVAENPARLNRLLTWMRSVDAKDLSGAEAKAFWINAYNITVIKSVIDAYPIGSPMEVPGFFDEAKHVIAGRELTLNDVENTILRERFPDAGIHFVLVCAAEGCPPIVPFAYEPRALEEQIARQTKRALNDDRFVVVDEQEEEVRVSEIFQWYADDFTKEAGSIADYIDRYREKPLPRGYSIAYYPYDWTLNDVVARPAAREPDRSSNIQSYTPAKLLEKGQIEIKLFNNFYTQTAYRDADGNKIEQDGRSTFYTGLIQLLYGTSESARVNFGLDVNLKSVYNDPDPSGSFLEVLSFPGGADGRTAIGSFGPKIKFAPFSRLTSVSIQSAFWIPGAADLEGESNDRPWLDYDRYTWLNQLFFDQRLGSKLQLFLEAAVLSRIPKDFGLSDTEVVTPVSAFLSYFPHSRATVYSMLQVAPTVTTASTYYAQAAIGGKLQATRHLEVELLWSHFFASSNAGAGSTYNLGLRWLR